jgi:O-antigen/teichoic acid export membrane protein
MTLSKALKKLNNKHIQSLAGNGAVAILSVVTYGILYRILPEADMGNWIFYQFAFIFLDSFRTGFLQTAVIKFYAGTEESRKAEVIGSCWYIALLITSLLAIPDFFAFFALNEVMDGGVRLFIQWYAINLFLTLPFNVTFWILQADQRFDRILVLRLINQGSFILFVLAILLFRNVNIETVIYLNLSSALLTSLVSIILAWSQLATLRNKTSDCVKKLFHFGKYSVGSYVFSTLFRSSDAFIIKFMLGPAALAVYNLPQRLMEVVEIPVRSFLANAIPEMSAAYNQNNSNKVIFIMKKYVGILTMFLIPLIVVMVISADVLVALVGGSKYLNTESANVFRIIVVCSILFPLERFPGITLDVIHKPQLNLVKVILSLLVNIVVDITAVKVFGTIYGVAFASVFTLLFGVYYGYVVLNRYLPFKVSGILKLGYLESRSLMTQFSKRKASS